MSQYWRNDVHLATIRRFGLENMGILLGAAVRATIAKCKNFRSRKFVYKALHVGKISMVLRHPIHEHDCW